MNRRDRRAELRMSSAAVMGQELEQFAHAIHARRVKNEAAVLGRRDEPGVPELLQVKGKRRTRDPGTLADHRGVETRGPGLDQHAKDREPGFLGERTQRFDGVFRFHNTESTNLPMSLQHRVGRTGWQIGSARSLDDVE